MSVQVIENGTTIQGKRSRVILQGTVTLDGQTFFVWKTRKKGPVQITLDACFSSFPVSMCEKIAGTWYDHVKALEAVKA